MILYSIPVNSTEQRSAKVRVGAQMCAKNLILPNKTEEARRHVGRRR